MANNVLEVKGLSSWFATENGDVKVIDDVSFSIAEGEIFGLVGESGSGKSVTSRSIIRLLPEDGSTAYEGSILVEGTDVLRISESRMRAMRGNEIAMVFQDPMSALNPVYTIGDQIMESILTHRRVGKAQARKLTIETLDAVGYPSPEQALSKYPHQLSGGMRQRVVIAIAVACRPKLLIADEPTTALDVTTQKQIVDLILDLSQRFGMAVLFISHDLNLVADISNRVAVMYHGRIVEQGTVESIFDHPQRAYTKGLISCIPPLHRAVPEELATVPANLDEFGDLGPAKEGR
ncbi:ABC transporter ATP-binding protein [Brevibacterium sp.]|uniref:ABC transporter ATP-binding protein n=1 Tax=Brevibacterium sp. TaxID=1701 RepID=UPI0025BF1D73|nr:ABC transporter ATP-binding protein [Brevibacterium sp.]